MVKFAYYEVLKCN